MRQYVLTGIIFCVAVAITKGYYDLGGILGAAFVGIIAGALGGLIHQTANRSR